MYSKKKTKLFAFILTSIFSLSILSASAVYAVDSATVYTLEYDTNSDFAASQMVPVVVSGTNGTASIPSLDTKASTYYYRIIATASDGTMTPSGSFQFSPTSGAAGTTGGTTGGTTAGGTTSGTTAGGTTAGTTSGTTTAGTTTGTNVDATVPKITVKFDNPLPGVKSIPDLVSTVLSAIALLSPIVIIMMLYAGILFVTAQGNTEKLTTAKKALMYTLLGAAIVLGAKGFSVLITSSVKCLAGGSC